jgi:hypothetical protein
MADNLFNVNDVSLSDIGYKNKLKSHNIYYTLINQIVDLITKIPEFNKLRCETELVRTVCNMIENSTIPKKNSDGLKIDKKQLVLDCLQRVFNYNEQEKQIISAMIDFLISNKFVKKLSYYKLSKNFIKKYTKTK